MRTTLICKNCAHEWASQAQEKTTVRCAKCQTPQYIPVGRGRPRAGPTGARATTSAQAATSPRAQPIPADIPPRPRYAEGRDSDGSHEKMQRERTVIDGSVNARPAAVTRKPPVDRPAMDRPASKPQPAPATRKVPTPQGTGCQRPGCVNPAEWLVTWEGDSPHPMLTRQGGYCRGDRDRLTTRPDVRVVRLNS